MSTSSPRRRDIDITELVGEVSAKTPSGRLIGVEFYKPKWDGSCEPTTVPFFIAQRALMSVHQLIESRTAEILQEGPYVDEIQNRVMLERLAAWGIYPVGAAIAVDRGQLGLHCAGSVNPLTRVVRTTRAIGELSSHLGLVIVEPDTYAHELGHLANLSAKSTFKVVRSNNELMVFDTPNAGWLQVELRVKQDATGRWSINVDSADTVGCFFEEATAELVGLKWEWDEGWPPLREPATFQSGSHIYTIPVEFGRSVAAWAVMMLEEDCPGVVEVLLDGARGRIDHARLRECIESSFPGLYDELNALHLATANLADGAWNILQRINR